MQLTDGNLILSATDLVTFLACKHGTALELQRARGEIERPYRDDPELELLEKRGIDHEQAYLVQLEAEGQDVEDLTAGPPKNAQQLQQAADATRAAMEAGRGVVYQPTLFDGRWQGRPDFLLRVERTSRLGNWSYDIADAKLAGRVKAAALLQLCVYAELVENIQGQAPDQLYVITGDGSRHAHRPAHYSAYYRHARRAFDRWLATGLDTVADVPSTYPDPVERCKVCSWWPLCIDQRRKDDHLSLVAGMSRGHARSLAAAGVTTLTAVAGLPTDDAVPDVNPHVLGRLRHQARLQAEYARTNRLRHELISPDPADPGHGLAALPEPSPHDVFFDIEADPWSLDGGLEYLLGVAYGDDEARDDLTYRALWGHDRAGEKQAFEAFIDLVTARLDRDPGMHVYHYGGYESGALKRLMQRHATREDEVDGLLRGRVLVDLYEVVRHGLRASVESYSLKQIEKLCGFERTGPVTQARFSVVQYEKWVATQEARLLQELADYNRDDCLALHALRSWLEERRLEAAPLFPDGVIPRPVPEDATPSEALTEQQAETAERVRQLTDGVPPDSAERTEEQQGRWLLAQLLDWHRREAKPAWWSYFRLRDAPMEDLFRDSEALAGLEYVGVVGKEKQSLVHRCRFDPRQDCKIAPGDNWIDPLTEKPAGRVVAIDELQGTIDLKRGERSTTPHPQALIAAQPISTVALRDGLRRVADHVIARGIEGPGPHRAVRDLILRQPPRVAGGTPGQPLVAAGEPLLDAARRLALALDETTLPVQGPPGTGKTWTGARMIVALVAAGRRVGVCAQAHRGVSNLLEEVARAGREMGTRVRIVQKCASDDDAAQDPSVERANVNEQVEQGLASGEYDVAGGTAWLFARAEMAGRLDVLVVDEAGQMSLANLVAMGGAARSIVLLGDPNQLPQVSQGTHPDGAEKSALEHLVGDATTVPEDCGLFLGVTYRLHPRVNAYISELFYEQRLTTAPGNEQQIISAQPVLPEGAGLFVVNVPHAGNSSRSSEEAEAVAQLIQSLLGQRWTDRHGKTRELDAGDFIVVAPYNAQVAQLRQTLESRLGCRIDVGTVDKFQGREGAVAIYSLATSTPDDAPRDMDFLYSGNRLNVATSRARSASFLVFNEALLDVECRTPDQMRLVNALCRAVEVAGSVWPRQAQAAHG